MGTEQRCHQSTLSAPDVDDRANSRKIIGREDPAVASCSEKPVIAS